MSHSYLFDVSSFFFFFFLQKSVVLQIKQQKNKNLASSLRYKIKNMLFTIASFTKQEQKKKYIKRQQHSLYFVFLQTFVANKATKNEKRYFFFLFFRLKCKNFEKIPFVSQQCEYCLFVCLFGANTNIN